MLNKYAQQYIKQAADNRGYTQGDLFEVHDRMSSFAGPKMLNRLDTMSEAGPWAAGIQKSLSDYGPEIQQFRNMGQPGAAKNLLDAISTNPLGLPNAQNLGPKMRILLENRIRQDRQK